MSSIESRLSRSSVEPGDLYDTALAKIQKQADRIAKLESNLNSQGRRVNDRNTRIAELETALTAIRGWEATGLHPIEIARQALQEDKKDD